MPVCMNKKYFNDIIGGKLLPAVAVLEGKK
jgi:hypothetical protein